MCPSGQVRSIDVQSGGNEDLLVLWGYWVWCTRSIALDSASE